MNAKKAKQLRRALREYAQIDSVPPAFEYNRDPRTGVVRLLPASPRAVYRKTKRIVRESARLA
jgi:hypothetical protein